MAIGPDDHVFCPSRPRCASAASIRWRTRVSALPPSRARRPARPLMGRSETLHVHHSGAPIAAHGRAALRELGNAAIAHQTGCLVGLPGRPRTIGLGCLFRLHHLSPFKSGGSGRRSSPHTPPPSNPPSNGGAGAAPPPPPPPDQPTKAGGSGGRCFPDTPPPLPHRSTN